MERESGTVVSQHFPGNISRTVLFLRSHCCSLSSVGKGLTGHSRHMRKILLRGCKFFAVLWSVEALRQKPKWDPNTARGSSCCWWPPCQAGRESGKGTAMRGLGPSIDLGSLFSELMDGMENNSLSCLTASLLLTAQRRGGRLSLATRLRLTTALEDSEAGDRDGPLAPGQGPAPPVPQDCVTVTARGMGRTGMHRDVPQGLTARSSGRSPRENPGSPGWPQPVYLGGAPQTVRPGDGSSHLCSPGPLGNVHPLFQHPINHRLLFLIRLLLTHPHCPAGDGAQPQAGGTAGAGLWGSSGMWDMGWGKAGDSVGSWAMGRGMAGVWGELWGVG